MFLSDPVAYLFKNTNPRGSLAANVSNVTVRCLSNMRLAEMLEDRHRMSSIVRDEVTNKSREWGYSLGSVYIRKVHFRDVGMIKQIESKVVNRLRQVTSAIKQDGANRVSIITSTAHRTCLGQKHCRSRHQPGVPSGPPVTCQTHERSRSRVSMRMRTLTGITRRLKI
jgi:hypothetical protein